MRYSFKDFRQRVGISQESLGNLLGLSRVEMNTMENQQRNMPFDLQNILAKWEAEFSYKAPSVDPDADYQYRILVTATANEQLDKLKEELARTKTIIKRGTRTLTEMQAKYTRTLQLIQFYDFVLTSESDLDKDPVVYERRKAIHALSKCSPMAQAVVQDRIRSATQRIVFLEESIAMWESMLNR